MVSYLETLRILHHYLPNVVLLSVDETKIKIIKKYNVHLMKLQSPVQSSGLWSRAVIWWYFTGPRHERYRRRRPTKRTKIKVTGLFQHILLLVKVHVAI